LENTNKLTKFFQIIFLAWSYRCTTQHSPGMDRKIWGTRLILSLCSEHCGFASLHVVRWNEKTVRVRPTGRYTRLQNP